MNEFKVLLAIIPALKELIFKQQPPWQTIKQNKQHAIILGCVLALAITALFNASFFKDEHKKVIQLSKTVTVTPDTTVPPTTITVPPSTFDKKRLKEQLESEE